MFIFFISVIFVGLVYLALAFLINKDNARYLLAGYNTMGEEERKKFPIDNYLIFFKKFFYGMAIFTFISSIILYLSFEEEMAIMLWAIFQIVPYFYFIYKSLKY